MTASARRFSLSIAIAALLSLDTSTLPLSATQVALLGDGARAPAGERADGDRDADGVINALDNCVLAANTDQRDTDRDGIGNRCDPDLDQNDLVNDDDLHIMLAGSLSRDADLNGDGTADLHDLAILRSMIGHRPGPRMDTDGDGEAESEDPCPQTRSGDRMLLPGCSALDIVRRPEGVITPLLDSLHQTAVLLAGQRDLAAAEVALESANNHINEAVRAVRAGGICVAADAATGGIHQLELASAELDASIRRLEGVAPPTVDAEPPDVTESELAAAGLRIPQHWVTLAQQRARVIQNALAELCAAALPLVTTATVERVRDGRRLLETTDGRVYVLAHPLRLDGPVFDGRRVRGTGVSWDEGTGILTGLAPAGTLPRNPPVASAQCVQLRVAPVQLLPPYSEGPFLLHHPEGYQLDGRYWLEQGMALSTVQTCPAAPGIQYTRYSLQILIGYRDRHTGLPIPPTVLAADLRPADDPVILPSRIDPDADATLIVTARAQTCLTASTCSEPIVLDVRTYDVVVLDRGNLCEATYNATLFDVDDQVPPEFRSAVVDSFTAAMPSDSPLLFEADGYAAPFFLFSTFPTVVTIGSGMSFALHNHDFHPIHQFDPADLGMAALVARLTTGVAGAAGLKWPRTRGTRNGRPFQYSCSLPNVVRDAVNLCDSLPPAFYRMPFPPADEGWTQGQGNLSNGTHKNGYAYDMLADEGTPMQAARAGRVIVVEEANSLGLGDPGCEDPVEACPANKFTVWHQDGTVAEYVHSPQDGVIVEVGDLVRRGQETATVGRTGRASAPHLHIGAATAPRPLGTNILHLYEAVDPDDGAVTLTCYEPQKGHPLRSNNTPWP